MKTKFFKKLSFVLVVAMVLSVFYPAAGAFAAAKKPTLNSTNKYLHLDVEGKNKFNFNINNKKSGWKYYWESANEDVAVVNSKNGVTTATGVGKTKVTVTITDKNKEVVTKLYATVTVRDNIKTVKITNIPEGNKLAVGQENDFNRSFVTVSGSTKKTSAITRWTVDSDKATINDKGVFVANEAGEYTITARSFQSNAKYEDWKKDADTYAKYVLAEDTVKITVAASMVEAKQVDLDTVNVVFDSAVEDVDKNIAVYRLVGNTKVKQSVAKVKMSDDKTVATVDLYIPFDKGSTYVVEYPGMESVSFVAATTNAEDVVDMKITTTTAVVGKATDIEFKLFNKDNVDITTDALKARVTMDADNVANTWLNKDAKQVTIFEKGASLTVNATFHSYKYDTTTGEEINPVKTSAVIIGVDEAATNVTGLNAWTIVAGTPNFDDVNQKLAVGDQDKAAVRLFAQLNLKKGDDESKTDSNTNSGHFKFVSSDESVLIITDNGYLYPVKPGKVDVVVHYGTGTTKTPVAVITITVSSKATATYVTLDTREFSLSNHPGLNDNKNVKVTVKDQLNRAYDFDKIKVERVSAPVEDGVMVPDQLTNIDEYPVTSDNGEYTINFNADNKKKGTYVYRITVAGISRIVEVNVLEPSSSEVGSRRLELSTTSQDMKVNSTDSSFEKAVTIKVVAYAQNGVKLREEKLGREVTEANYYVVVKAPYDSTGNFITDEDNNGSYKVVKTLDDGKIVKAPVGTYVVTAYEKETNKVIGTQSFVTTDSQPKAVLSKINHQYIKTELSSDDIANKKSAKLIAVVNDALEFKVDGNDVEVVEVSATGHPNSIAINSVKVKYEIKTGFYLEYTVNTNGILLQKR